MPTVLLAPLAVFSGIWFMQVAMPGPNFVRISDAALRVSRQAAMITALGTSTGNAIWCVLALAGAAVLVQLPALSLILRLAGALYLAAYGVRMLLRALGRHRPLSRPDQPFGGPAAFLSGLLTALSNVQAAIFFATTVLALFPVMSLTIALAVVGLVFAINLSWYAFVTRLLTTPRPRAAYEGARRWIELAFAGLLLAAAGRILAVSAEIPLPA